MTVSIRGKTPSRRFTQDLLAPGWYLLPAITTNGSLTVGQVFSSIAPSQILRYDPAVPPNGSLITVQASDPARTGEAYYVQVLGQTPSTWTPPLPVDVTTRFGYDGDGGRVKQTTPAGTTTYLGESVEIAPDGTTTKYVFAGSQRIAAVAQSPQPGAPSVLRYYHTDHLGSSNVVTEGSGPNVGQVLQQLDYTPYGSVHANSGSVNVPHQFTGQRQDATNGLILFPARAYDPSLGRFLQPDPFIQDPSDPQTFNRYAYVRNSPVNLVDPSGYGWLSNFFQRLFGRDGESSGGGGGRIFIPIGPFFVAYDPQREEVMVGLWAGGSGGHGEVGLFYNWERRQAGVYIGGYTANGYGEGRLYYDFRENDVQASIELQSQNLSFFANTDGQRTLNGQSLKAAKASLQDFGVSEPAAKSFLKTISTPQAVQIVQGLGWMAVGGALMAGSVGGTVASGGLALEVSALLAIGGAAIAAAGALQVSYAIRAPFDTYPGQTQGKITSELNKAYEALTYGRPSKWVPPPPWKPKTFWQKVGFYLFNTIRTVSGHLDELSEFFR